MKHLWEVDHPYYCSTACYYTTERLVEEHRSFAEFLAEMGNADNDMNLVFRWDWQEGADHELPEYNGDDNYRHACLRIFYFHQRKGHHSCHQVQVCRADEAVIIEFLKPKLAHFLKLWEPLA